MKTGILIVARLGSTRLLNKHLVVVEKRTFIEWLAIRFVKFFQSQSKAKDVEVIIATSANGGSKKFAKIFDSSPVKVFFGSDENIPLRQLECAKKFGLTNIISIDGDDILCSVTGAMSIFDWLSSGESAAKISGLPLGMNSMGYKVSYLEKCLNNFDTSKKLETGWGRIFTTEMKEYRVDEMDKDNRLRFTLDYEQDSAFFRNIIEHFGEKIFLASDKDIINYVIENNVYKFNAALNDTYWDNFNNMKRAEL